MDHQKHRVAHEGHKISWKTKKLLGRWCGATGNSTDKDRESWRTGGRLLPAVEGHSLEQNKYNRLPAQLYSLHSFFITWFLLYLYSSHWLRHFNIKSVQPIHTYLKHMNKQTKRLSQPPWAVIPDTITKLSTVYWQKSGMYS